MLRSLFPAFSLRAIETIQMQYSSEHLLEIPGYSFPNGALSFPAVLILADVLNAENDANDHNEGRNQLEYKRKFHARSNSCGIR